VESCTVVVDSVVYVVEYVLAFITRFYFLKKTGKNKCHVVDVWNHVQ